MTVIKTQPYSEDEIREQVLDHLADMLHYWETLPDKTLHERMDGLVFSVLTMLDGCTMTVPGFKVIPCPHPDDKEYHQANGEQWYPDDVDIGGGLHEYWSQSRKRGEP